MGKGKRRGLSVGSVVMIALTIAVLGGSLRLLERMSRGTEATLRADELISSFAHSLASTDAPTGTPEPQNTIKTTTVTIAPAEPKAQDQISATEEPVLHTFTLTVGGLLSFQSDISDSVYHAEQNAFDYASIAEHLAFSVYSDLNLFTLNNLLTASDNGYADINTVPQVLDAAKMLGADQLLLNHAHILDKGVEGAQTTIAEIEKQGLSVAGIENFDSQGNGRIVSLNGVRIAVLGYADSVSSKTREAMNGTEMLSRLDIEAVKNDIAAVRAQGADFVLVSLYWGKADTNAITNAQRNTAQELAQSGADMIVGVGPDAVFPVEMIDTVGKDGVLRKTLVAYSLGSLLREGRDNRAQVSGALLHTRIAVDTAENRVQFDAVTYTPTYIWKQEVNGNIVFRILPSTMDAPADMNERQREIMGRALVLIDEVMAEGPAVRREK